MVVMTMTMRDSLTNAKKRHARDDCDEYYTSEALAHRLVDHCEAIGARKLVLPCDTDASRIAIYARERAAAGAFDDVAVFDDFETALDTVDKSYHIVTNPPFSKLARLIYPRVVDWAGGFTLVAPVASFLYAALREKWRECFFFRPRDPQESVFDRPGGGAKHHRYCVYHIDSVQRAYKKESDCPSTTRRHAVHRERVSADYREDAAVSIRCRARYRTSFDISLLRHTRLCADRYNASRRGVRRQNTLCKGDLEV